MDWRSSGVYAAVTISYGVLAVASAGIFRQEKWKSRVV